MRRTSSAAPSSRRSSGILRATGSTRSPTFAQARARDRVAHASSATEQVRGDRGFASGGSRFGRSPALLSLDKNPVVPDEKRAPVESQEKPPACGKHVLEPAAFRQAGDGVLLVGVALDAHRLGTTSRFCVRSRANDDDEFPDSAPA